MFKRISWTIVCVCLLATLIYHDLWNGLGDTELDRLIVSQIRTPRILTAILAGIALSISGLQMQTLFRNPLAGPYTLGVSGGASLGVALVTMMHLTGLSFWGIDAVVTAGIIGSTLVLLLVIGMARRIRNNTAMLIIGLMIGSMAGAIVNLIQNYANPDALKLFITWTLGSLSSVDMLEIRPLSIAIGIGLILSIALIKPLNGLALGENYARALGVNIERTRVMIVLSTGLLAGAITAYCGPIAFVGVAVPHIARGIMNTNDHRIILPTCALVGAMLMVACDILSTTGDYPLPVSTVSALFGAPIIIWIIVKGK